MTMTMKMTALLATLAIFWLGCGVDEEPIRPRVTRPVDRGLDLAKMSPEEREDATAGQDEQVVKYFAWPEGKAGERSAVADAQSCREPLLTNEKYVRGNGLVRFSLFSDCMENLGWVVDEAAVSERVTGGSAR